MNSDDFFGPDIHELIRQAREGGSDSLAKVLEPCRVYLLAVANASLGAEVRGKMGASDLVQDTFVAAQRGFAQFRGATSDELLAWLKQILLNQIAQAKRSYVQTDKRNVNLEASLSTGGGGLASPLPSPSQSVISQEDLARMNDAISQLSNDYRQAIEFRSFSHKSFAEIGQAMNRSEEAARKLWARAIERLAELMEDSS